MDSFKLVTFGHMGKKEQLATKTLLGSASNGKRVKEQLEGLAKETRSNVTRIIEIERTQQAGRTSAERLAASIARFCGSMTFVWFHVLWFGGWVVLNTLFDKVAFDPFPFTFLTLVVSLEAIFLSTFILISQNHETELSERRNHLDLQINMLTEQENTKLLEMVSQIAEKLGVKVDDPVVENMLEDMDPETLVEQIMAVKGEEAAEQVAGTVSEKMADKKEANKVRKT